MRKKLNEAALLSKYFTLLTEASDVLSHFGSNINPALRKAVIELHQSRVFSHEAGNITQVDKVAWRDIKGQYATGYSPGKSIAIVGTGGSAIIHPYNSDTWTGVMVTNDMQSFRLNDSSINNMLKDIKPQLGKAKEFYLIRYKRPKSRPAKTIGDTRSYEKVEKDLIKKLAPFLQKRAVKAKAELNSMIISMVKGDVSQHKLSKKMQKRQQIMNYLEDPDSNSNIAQKVLAKALVATVNYYDPDTRVDYSTPSVYSGISKLFWTDKSGTMNKIKNNDISTLATVAYFIERAWLSI